MSTGFAPARLFVILAGLLVTACGGAGSSPSSLDEEERVFGVWIGNATLTAVSGGECVGRALESAVGRRDVFAASITQRGADIDATVAYQGNRTSCALAGRAASGAISLNLTGCHSGRIEGLRCSNGDARALEMVTGRVTAEARNGTGTGADVSTWNVFPAGEREPVGTLTLTATFRWNLSRLPPSDFHIFDGSILPGYVDGVVTIPEEPDPFCTTCGWFSSGAFSP
jgi:hypothetical protein